MTLLFHHALEMAKHATAKQGILWDDVMAEDQASALHFASDALSKAIDLLIVTESRPVIDNLKTARQHVTQLRHHLAASSNIDALFMLDRVDTQIVAVLNGIAVRILPAPTSGLLGADTHKHPHPALITRGFPLT